MNDTYVTTNNGIAFEPITKHRIGTVTYEVNTFFDADESTLKDKLLRIISEDTRKNTIDMFAGKVNNAVK